MSERTSFDAAEAALRALRMPDEADLIVAVGAHAPSTDCRNGYVSITIRRGKDEATSEAVHLIDAAYLARGKLNAMERKREAEKAEAAMEQEKVK
ncbi:hypothetical protein [Stakelama pacifica]|uniref:Uncharacterized protein n=1 Tax=Stakelama pacifica TaxID=517720 RepID=A0A4R6FJT3_9SPHN|nr:hypothetical protein [Stakelama pacifica]TDN81741.1 hypothetical protein EV664_107143 [Stakelama pacifica]GGO96430.1 hypothetical protein GCM10011329_22940 [Stakelama pacifica]